MTTQAVMGGVFLWQKCPSNESNAGCIFSCGKKVLDLPNIFFAILFFNGSYKLYCMFLDLFIV